MNKSQRISKKPFHQNIEAQWLEIDAIDIPLGKVRGLTLLFKPELQHSTGSSMLAQMTDKN